MKQRSKKGDEKTLSAEEAKEILEEIADVAKKERELKVRKAKVFVRLLKFNS